MPRWRTLLKAGWTSWRETGGERRKWKIDLVRRDEFGRVLLPKTIQSERGIEVIEINDVAYVLPEPGIAVEWFYFCSNCYKDSRYDSPDCDRAYGANYAADFAIYDPEGFTPEA
jgi:hypothetical protein